MGTEKRNEVRGIQSEAVCYAGGSSALNLRMVALRCATGVATVIPGSRSQLFLELGAARSCRSQTCIAVRGIYAAARVCPIYTFGRVCRGGRPGSMLRTEPRCVSAHTGDDPSREKAKRIPATYFGSVFRANLLVDVHGRTARISYHSANLLMEICA